MPRTLLTTAVLVVVALALPARADTQSDLDAAKRDLEAKRVQLTDLTRRWQSTEAALARAQDDVVAATLQIVRLQDELQASRRRFDRRVAEMYMGGGSPSFVMVLTSDSVNDAFDRWEFASSVAQSDQDLAIDVAYQTEQIRRERERLRDAVTRQAAAAASLGAQREALGAAVANLADAVGRLQDKLKVEQAVASGGPYPVTGSGAISTCPVAGPNAFVDSFGDPRPGGRTHQGIDMIAPYGTPVVAVHSGTVRLAPNTLGGNAVVLYHDGSADSSYYAHLSSYGATGNVAAGTVIGHVGSTGDTNVNHLHFEYHPGGGAAVDPYRLLLAVC